MAEDQGPCPKSQASADSSGFAVPQCGKALPFRMVVNSLSRLRLETGGVASAIVWTRLGKASLTALGCGKPQTSVHLASKILPRMSFEARPLRPPATFLRSFLVVFGEGKYLAAKKKRAKPLAVAVSLAPTPLSEYIAVLPSGN